MNAEPTITTSIPYQSPRFCAACNANITLKRKHAVCCSRICLNSRQSKKDPAAHALRIARYREENPEKKESARLRRIATKQRKKKEAEDMTVNEIIRSVAAKFGITDEGFLFTGSRTPPYPKARFHIFDELSKIGWDNDKIAARFGFTRGSVTYGLRIARGEQRAMRSVQRVESNLRFERWAKEYKDGWGIYKIAKRSGVDRSSVYYGLIKMGAYVKP